VTCCKNDYFEVFAQILENLLGVGTNVDSCFYDLASWESDGQFDVEGRSEGVVAMD